MKFIAGLLGAIIFAVIAWLVIGAIDVETGVLTYVIAGVVTFIGFSIAQVIYEKIKKKREVSL